MHKGVFEQGAAGRCLRYPDSAVQAGEPMTAKVLTGRPSSAARSVTQLNR
jgi:hypothetical protein